MGIENPENKIILFSIGRWVERKGFHWFLEHVMSDLNPDKFHYILAGFGPYEGVYRKIIDELSIQNVTLLGKVDDIFKARLFCCSNYFVMPNISVHGDIE